VTLITTGEGGLVTTEDDEYARLLRAFRTHGIVREDLNPGPFEGSWYYEMRHLGFNYRITDIQCALGMSQLARLPEWVATAQRAGRALPGGPGRRGTDRPAAGRAGWLAPRVPPVRIRVLAGAEARLRTFEALRAAGIGVQVHYIPVYRLPYYRDTLGLPLDQCPATEEYYAGAITLPLFPAMTDDDVDRVVDELGRCLP
jgi:dTDP-4-amino-4,6-dideoxygalactose transaminase